MDRMTRVTDGLWHLRTLMVNVYAVEANDAEGGGDKRGWVLIDTGLPGFTSTIIDAAARVFGSGSRPRSIVLTHGHFDHAGCVEELADHWEVPVYASRQEAPFLTGRESYPPPDPLVGRGALSLLSPLYPRGPIDISSRLVLLPADDRVPGLDGWRVFHTPGHSPGHMSLFREAGRVLVAGDAVTTTQQESLVAVATQRVELHGPPAYYTIDWIQAAASAAKLAGLNPQVLATGHGRPIAGDDVAGRLHALADRFSQTELPEKGRYVSSPARMNEDGSMSLPPNPLPRLLMRGAAMAAVTAVIAIRERRENAAKQRAGTQPREGDPAPNVGRRSA